MNLDKGFMYCKAQDEPKILKLIIGDKMWISTKKVKSIANVAMFCSPLYNTLK